MLTALLALHVLSSVAHAEPGFSAEAAWRPTLRRAYIFYGTDTAQIPLGALIAGQEPEAGHGLANNVFEPGRFEASLHYHLGDGLMATVSVLGGPFAVQFAEDQPRHEGSDWNIDLGGSVFRRFDNGFRFETQMAGRVRIWTLGDDIPLHGNIGVVLGVQPEYKGFFLRVESTLSAVWLTDLTAWGAQKDSSILRIRPGYIWRHEDWSLSGALDYYHTHSEFFGTELIPGQQAFMLDDFDLALVLGVGRKF